MAHALRDSAPWPIASATTEEVCLGAAVIIAEAAVSFSNIEKPVGNVAVSSSSSSSPVDRCC